MSGRITGSILRWRPWRISLYDRFLLTLCLVLALAMVALGSWVNNRATYAVLERNVSSSAFYLRSLVAPHVQSLATDNLLTAGEVADLTELSDRLAEVGDVLAIKVWRLDGTLAYSRDRTLDTGPEDDMPAKVLSGAPLGRFGELRGDVHRLERHMGVRFYEVFTPITELSSGRVIAIGEFYRNAEAVARTLRGSIVADWWIFGAAGLAMFLALSVVVRHGSVTIERQRARLEEHIDRLARLHEANRDLSSQIDATGQRAVELGALTEKRIGAELHDGAGQLLALLLLWLDRLEGHIAAGTQRDLKAARVALADIRGSARAAMEEIRSVASGLMVPELDGLGNLGDMLEGIVRRHAARTGSTVDGPGPVPEVAMPPERLYTLGRIVQEALSNAFKHAGGAGQQVRVAREGTELVLRVLDRGPGPAEGAGGGLGLRGMRFRAESLGGTLELRGRRPAGTELVCRIPVPDPQADATGG